MEAAGVVEGLELGVEVDVEPIEAAGFRDVAGVVDELATDAAAAVVRVDGGLEEEGVDAAVPGGVDETDQAIGLVAVVGADVDEAT